MISSIQPSPAKCQSYDIIILGGGTAGCVLASRLSADSSLRVLVLEAGPNHNNDPRVRIPALFSQTFGDPTIDYGYLTTPQAGLDGKQIYHARGKGLGGSSLINYMALVHPSKTGLDAWAKIGNTGWSWNDMLPYLQKYQTWNEPPPEVSCALHLDEYIDRSAQGKSGPVQASYQDVDQLEPSSLNMAWLDAFRTLGWEMRGDTLSGANIGAYHVTSAVHPKTRERSHAAMAYLDPITKCGRDNLEIVTECVVDKVLFETGKVTPRAKSVQFVHNEEMHVVEATKEIILCSGTFGNVCILERSGVGSKGHLEALGAEIVIENQNVGENLQDHIMCGVSFEVNEDVCTAEKFQDPAYVAAAMEEYQKENRGPLAGTSQCLAYMPLLEDDEDHSRNDTSFQRLIDNCLSNQQQDIADKSTAQAWSEAFTLDVLRDNNEASANVCMVTTQADLRRSDMKEAFAFSKQGSYTGFYTALAYPLSRGRIHAASLSPLDAPKIDPRYYSHPLDVELMARHVQLFDRLRRTEPMKSVLKPNGQRIPEWASFDNLDETKKLLKSSAMSNQHPCGSCSMLPREKGGVVDHRLKVYGAEGLRVCDASIIPLIPRGNIMSTVYALAEKGADILKEDLNNC